MSFLTYLYRRLALYWQVLLTLALGILLAVTLLASGPVMVESILDFALRRTLSSSEPLDANLRLMTTRDPDESAFLTLDARVHEIILSRFGDYLDQVVPMGETRWTHPWLQGVVLKDQRVNFSFYSMEPTSLLAHAEFISGGWPEDIRPSREVTAVVIGSSMAAAYELEVGDRLPLSMNSSADQPDLWIEVSGIIRPLDVRSPFWFGAHNPLRSEADTRYLAQYSVLIPSKSLFDLGADFFAASDVQIAWNVLLSPRAIKIDDLPRIQEQLDAIGPDTEALRIRVETGLSETAERIATHTESVRVPLYLLIVTVVLLALYYVLMVATLSLRQASREFAVLLSRGASTWQLSSVKLAEAGIICGVAFLSGPGLAVVLMRGLILFGPLADTSREYWALQLPQAAWLAAIVGALACLLSIFSPLPGAVRRSVVTYAQTLSRSGRPPWWQRYYLDVVFMLVGLILLWRLRIYGGILSESGGGPQVDWLLLLAPLALLLGAATIMLRIFPLLLRLMARLVTEIPGLPGALAFWQAARDPGHIARLVLLLTLAMALGSLSSGLNVALDRNEVDRAYYATGGDLRLQLDSKDQRSTSQGVVSETTLAAQSIRSVNSLTRVLRTTGSLQLTIENAHPPFDVLAIGPQSLQTVVKFRRDYADDSVLSLLNQLAQVETDDLLTLPLPGYPTKIGMWLLMPFEGEYYVDPLARIVSVPLNRISVVVKLYTAKDEILTVQLSPVDPTVPLSSGWHYFEGQIPSFSYSSYPVSLLSFWFRYRQGSDFYNSTIPQLAVDGLTVVDGKTGKETVLDLFESEGSDWSTTEPNIIFGLDDVYPRLGGERLLLDLGLSGIDSTNWIGVNLRESALGLEENGEKQVVVQDPEVKAEDEFTFLLPGQPAELGVWLIAPLEGRFVVGPDTFQAVGDLTTVDFAVRLRAQGGEVILLPLQSMGEQPQQGYYHDKWQYFWVDLPSYAEDQYPLVLESFTFRIREGVFLPILIMDSLTLTDKDSGEDTVIEEFEGLSPPYWRLDPSEGVGYARFDIRSREGSGLFLIFDDYGDFGDQGWVNLSPIREPPPTALGDADAQSTPEGESDGQDPILPVLVSPAFVELTQAEVGDRLGAWIHSKPFVLDVMGEVKYFPTMLEDEDAGYVITLRDPVLNHFNRTDYLPHNINEIFVSLNQGILYDEVVDGIRNSVGEEVEVLNAENLRQKIKADPLALGLRSVTTLGYLLTSVLSLVGFGTYFYMSVRQRRKMYGVLRAIGMSSAQMYGSLLLEQVVLILLGLALGTSLGVLLNQLTLPGLPLSLGDQPPIPPFLAEIDWAGVLGIYFTLAVAFLLSLGLATISLSRARLHQVLRVDEE